MVTLAETRYLEWYIHTNEGDSTSAGPVYILDREYRPRVVRVHVKRQPDADDMTLDIKDDGTSIFEALPRLVKGQTSDEVVADFFPSADSLAKYSQVSLDLTPNGAAGITVILELVAEEGEQEDMDT